jgi:hypothetical protein
MEINEFPATNGGVSPNDYAGSSNCKAVFTGKSWIVKITDIGTRVPIPGDRA